MLNPDLVPTPLVLGTERLPVPIERPRRERLRTLKILFYLDLWLFSWLWTCLVALMHHLARRLLALFGIQIEKYPAGAVKGRQARRLLERLGFLWVKVGQLLSLRADVLSPEVCAELSKLQHRSVGFPPECAVQIIERELCEPLGEIFAEFEWEPLAAASIAQVHRARLRSNGARVVVKVMRPAAERIFAKDLRFLCALVRVLDWIPQLEIFRFDEFIWELEQITREEVDYRFELVNLRRLRKNLRKRKVYVPKAYGRHSTRRVLVMEEIQGALMSDYIEVGRTDPLRLESWLAENRIDPEKVARRLLFSFLRQLFEDNLFHGDLHPGNIFLLRDSRIALIDVGALGTAEADMVRRYEATLKSFASKEFQRGSDLTMSFSPKLPLTSLVEVREEIIRVLRAWEIRTHVKALPYHERSLSNLFVEVTKVMADSGVGTSWGLLRIDRSLTTMDASLNALLPQADYPALFREYFHRQQQRLVRRVFRLETFWDVVGALQEAYNDYRLFIEPRFRMLSRVFDVGLDLGYGIASIFFRLLSIGMFVAGVFLTAVFFHQEFNFMPDAQAQVQGGRTVISLQGLIAGFPLLSPGVWIAVGLLVLALMPIFWGVGARLKRNRIWVPSGPSGPSG